MLNQRTVVIFHAAKKPNAKGEYNWMECVPYEGEVECSKLQMWVGGYLTLIPHKDRIGQFIAYADEEGLIKKSARNDLAGGTLYQLGFRGGELLGMAYAGNVVLVNRDEKGLNTEQIEMVQQAMTQYRNEMDN